VATKSSKTYFPAFLHASLNQGGAALPLKISLGRLGCDYSLRRAGSPQRADGLQEGKRYPEGVASLPMNAIFRRRRHHPIPRRRGHKRANVINGWLAKKAGTAMSRGNRGLAWP